MNINPTSCNFKSRTINQRAAYKCKEIVEEAPNRIKNRVKTSKNSQAMQRLNKNLGGTSIKDIKNTWDEGIEFLADLVRAQF